MEIGGITMTQPSIGAMSIAFGAIGIVAAAAMTIAARDDGASFADRHVARGGAGQVIVAVGAGAATRPARGVFAGAPATGAAELLPRPARGGGAD